VGDIRQWAQRYIDEGAAVLPIPKGEKGPRADKWQTRTFTAGDFRDDDNIGLRLGDPSGGLVDVDIDVLAAVPIASRLLPLTGRIHGRPSKPASHRWYLAKGLKTTQFTDLDRHMLIELRSTGGQTVVPPSVHPSGEPLVWEQQRPPGVIAEPETLLAAVRDVALATLLAKHWPAKGVRRELRLAWAGFFVRLGLLRDHIVRVLELAAEAGGSDRNGVAHVARAVDGTIEKLAAHATEVIGGTRITELLPEVGARLIAKINKWFGRTEASAVDEAIRELNARYFVARVGSNEVIGQEDRDETVFQTPTDLRLRFANALVQVGEEVKGKGEQKIAKPVYVTKDKLWLTSKRRREFRCVVFAPPPQTCARDDYNLWRGFAATPSPDASGAGCARFLIHLRQVICAGHQDDYDYLLLLLAHLVTFPGIPGQVALALRSERGGTGKGLFARTIGDLFGRHFVHLDRTEHLTGRFNSHLSAKVLAFADEAIWASTKKELGALKRLITEPTLLIERKGIDAARETNCIHLITATNEEHSAPKGFGDRRWWTLHVDERYANDGAYFDPLYDEVAHGGREALLAFLQARGQTLTSERLPTPPSNSVESEIQQTLSLDPERQWWKMCLHEGRVGDTEGWPAWISSEDLWWAHLFWRDAMQLNGPRPTCQQLVRRLQPFMGEPGEARTTPRDERGRKLPGQTVKRQGRKLPSFVDSRRLFDHIAKVTTTWDEPAPAAEDAGSVLEF
jgi:hypothetical protein